jgi:hypothetical protein
MDMQRIETTTNRNPGTAPEVTNRLAFCVLTGIFFLVDA